MADAPREGDGRSVPRRGKTGAASKITRAANALRPARGRGLPKPRERKAPGTSLTRIGNGPIDPACKQVQTPRRPGRERARRSSWQIRRRHRPDLCEERLCTDGCGSLAAGLSIPRAGRLHSPPPRRAGTGMFPVDPIRPAGRTLPHADTGWPSPEHSRASYARSGPRGRWFFLVLLVLLSRELAPTRAEDRAAHPVSAAFSRG